MEQNGITWTNSENWDLVCSILLSKLLPMKTTDKYKEFKKVSASYLKRILKDEVSDQEFRRVTALLSETKINFSNKLQRFEYKHNQLSLSGLGRLYGFHKDTIKKYLEPIWDKVNKGDKKYFSFEQVQLIFEFMGLPNHD